MTPGSYVVVFASTRQGGDGAGITVCYWDTAESIAAWKRNVDHAAAQEQGRQGWYAEYAVTIARVERHYGKGD